MNETTNDNGKRERIVQDDVNSDNKNDVDTEESAGLRARTRTDNLGSKEYVPPKVWKPAETGSFFGGLNRPTAGPRHEKKLKVGENGLQLYSLGTPNGQKVTILLEELLAAGFAAEYDAWIIDISKGDQFGSDFVRANPNSKIPALLDYSDSKNSEGSREEKKVVRVFESGSILLYLAEKFGNAFLPQKERTEILNWLFWQVSSTPYLGGGFGYFYHYADQKQEHPINRYSMETKRQLDVLNRELSEKKFIIGDVYTIADMAIFPWYGQLALGRLYGEAKTFLNIEEEYPHVVRWANLLSLRPAVKRGLIVNRNFGDGPKLLERHNSSDIDSAFLESA